MFAKLKKKIAEETATTSWPGGAARMPRSVSKESVTSVGVDSGDDFPSDGSSSREDPSSQLFRRNEQVRKLEIKLSDYAEQVRNLQKIKEKLENALETHQDSFVKKLQEQNEAHQASMAKNVEGTASALERKDQEWKEKLSHLEKERKLLSAQLQEMREQSLNLFQKRDELHELEGFQQQELAKVKHMLLQKEESLARAEQGLASSTEELARAQEACQLSQAASSRWSGELQELKRQHTALQAERDKLLEVEENAERKVTALELRGQELQTYTQRLSVDLHNAQVATSGCEKRLEALQEEHGSLRAEYEQHKQKMATALEERMRLVGHLQDKVATLEKRLEGNLSGDDHVGELIREKSALEERLEATRHQLSVAQSSHTERLSLLESQRKDLEQALQLAQDAAAKSKEDAEGRERQIQALQSDLELERTKWQERASSVEHQRAEQMARLEGQVASLESEREAAQHKTRQLEKEKGELRERCRDLGGSLQSEQERLKAELSSALGEMQKQKEGLQHQVAALASSLKEKELLLAEKTAALLKEEEEAKHLRQGRDAVLLQMQHLQSGLELCQGQAAQREAAAEEQRRALQAQLKETQERLVAREKQVARLELASKALGGKPLCPPPGEGEGEPNGEVAARDVVQLLKEKRSLEQQLAEKNKIIKQLQQRMAELKKTLQRELKIRPDGETPEVPSLALTVTNNSDLNDSREINFEYLKHVVLKFMSCREAEAFHLIKAVSVLLNFSAEEESMLKETLEYKMSWFGSKPPPRGSIRPSISSPRPAW